YLYSVRDYAGALAELKIAGPKLPNEPGVFSLKASIQRRQGHWEESTGNFQRAIELDPRNWWRLRELGRSYGYLRRYAEQKSMLDRTSRNPDSSAHSRKNPLPHPILSRLPRSQPSAHTRSR